MAVPKQSFTLQQFAFLWQKKGVKYQWYVKCCCLFLFVCMFSFRAKEKKQSEQWKKEAEKLCEKQGREWVNKPSVQYAKLLRVVILPFWEVNMESVITQLP